MFRKIMTGVILSAFACMCSAAPLTFTDNGLPQTQIVDFDGNVNSTSIAGLTASATFSLLGVSGNTWSFEVVVSETGSVDARVAGLGFVAISPAFASGVVPVNGGGGTQWQFVDGPNPAPAFPNGFGSLVACLIDNANNCQGGGNGGVANGGTATVQFDLVFSAPTTSMSFEGLGVRYMSIEGVTAGTSGTGTGGDPRIPPDAIPEPSTYALIGGALVALQVLRKRK
jgi:hypothetical protein